MTDKEILDRLALLAKERKLSEFSRVSGVNLVTMQQLQRSHVGLLMGAPIKYGVKRANGERKMTHYTREAILKGFKKYDKIGEEMIFCRLKVDGFHACGMFGSGDDGGHMLFTACDEFFGAGYVPDSVLEEYKPHAKMTEQDLQDAGAMVEGAVVVLNAG